MPTSLNSRDNPSKTTAGRRLGSWKEIAAHLGRSERTVKRWEAERGLPVHRLPGIGRGSVYAFASEVDDWLVSSRVAEQPDSEQPNLDQLDLDQPKGDRQVNFRESPAESLPASQQVPTPAQQAANNVDGLHSIRHWRLAPAFLLLGLALIALLYWHGQSLESMRGTQRQTTTPGAAPNAALPASTADRTAARELYLKGRYEWSQRTPESLNRALDAFTQSIVHDPSYAEPYAGLAETYCLLQEYSTLAGADAYPRAIAAAQKAIELNASLPEGHRALAFAEVYGNWDFVGARKEFLRAIELNPNDAEARRWFANAFAIPGHFGESLAQIEKARELDPSSRSTVADMGWMLFNAGREKEGIELLHEAERSAPEFRSPHNYLMQAALDRGGYPAYLAGAHALPPISSLAPTQATRPLNLENLLPFGQDFSAARERIGKVRACLISAPPARHPTVTPLPRL